MLCPRVLSEAAIFTIRVNMRRPVTIFDPTSGNPFPEQPGARQPDQSGGQRPLGFIPLPNQPGAVQNYQFITSVPQEHRQPQRPGESNVNEERTASSASICRPAAKKTHRISDFKTR